MIACRLRCDTRNVSRDDLIDGIFRRFGEYDNSENHLSFDSEVKAKLHIVQ